MRASSGAHFIALDHVRALAAFMVFSWHFIHGNGYGVPMGYAPAIFPLALLDEGHTGVALFMTLSGYLFAKLLGDKSIDYKAFFWNRILRLIPLLSVVILVVGFREWSAAKSVGAYAWSIAMGAIFPTLPKGGWSITVEFHFYLLLPLLLWLIRKSKWTPVAIVVSGIALRSLIFYAQGEVQSLAYWTIVGRIDQFALGMLVFQFRDYFTRRHVVAIAALSGFAAIYWYLDSLGGVLLAPEQVWIFLPTIEGLAYAVGIAWYDNSFAHSTGRTSRFIGRIGEYSYSIYLLHVLVVFKIAKFMNEHILDTSNFYVACLFSLVFFLLMMPAGYLSFRFIEAPFLKLRKHYIIPSPGMQETPSQPAQQDEAAERLKCAAEL